MKIEMGESLFYSWLRHVKDCQIVQTNWTTSKKWDLQHQEELERLMQESAAYFLENAGYNIYKHTVSLSQLLQQAECDAIGISMNADGNRVYAVDVAFHEGGLNYGSKETTTTKIIAKSLRTAMCIYGYLDMKEAEIIFASPKIHNAELALIRPCFEAMQKFMDEKGFHYKFKLFANDDFKHQVLDLMLEASKDVADTNELFVRSHQLIRLLEGSKVKTKRMVSIGENSGDREKAYEELKIGKLARIIMGSILESGTVSEQEIKNLQTVEYSHDVLGITYPCLALADSEFDRKRYYIDPIHIRGKAYYLCSQWFEKATDNDRPYLIAWIKEHTDHQP